MANLPERGGPLQLGTTATLMYSAGDDATWSIIRCITALNEDIVVRKVTIGVNTTTADAAGKRVFAYQTEVQPGQVWEWNGYLPIFGHASTPDRVYGLADMASKVTVYVGAVKGP